MKRRCLLKLSLSGKHSVIIPPDYDPRHLLTLHPIRLDCGEADSVNSELEDTRSLLWVELNTLRLKSQLLECPTGFHYCFRTEIKQTS